MAAIKEHAISLITISFLANAPLLTAVSIASSEAQPCAALSKPRVSD